MGLQHVSKGEGSERFIEVKKTADTTCAIKGIFDYFSYNYNIIT